MFSFNSIRSLPILLPNKIVEAHECVEEEMAGGKIIVSHIFQPVFGPVYHASLSGKNAIRELFVDAMTQEFGPPLSVQRSSEIWHYAWPSDSLELPKTKVHELLGDEWIHEVCRKHELSEDQERILREQLVHMKTFEGNMPARLNLIAEAVEDIPPGQRMNIISALMEVCFAFFQKSHQR